MTEEVEPIQTATADFFGPIACAYLAVCATWLVVRAVAGNRWQAEAEPKTENRWLDFSLIFLVIACINLCIPYLPIFVVLAFRRQSFNTIWLSTTALPWKIGTGVLASVVGLLVFLGMRGEFHRLPEIGNDLFDVHSWVHAPAVFLEAVAVAFLFVRLKWVSSTRVALLVPCLLFALAHVPGAIANERTLFEIVSFLVFNTLLAAAIFAVVFRSRDVLWIAIPHFILDIAIGVFG